ncbi:MAG: hypothetical protein A2355_01690 [Spirochaetes bacterium RIFOXYB1_FULL_32_8]|nr:MAG: hypothetical protein A2355_01690 [Spirochaetes bacterium RIFOXYB1_FULL_32_8]
MLIRKISIIILGFIISFYLFGDDMSNDEIISQIQKKIFGTYQIPSDWVEVKQWSIGGKYFYTRKDAMSENPPTNISIEMGKNRYSEKDHEEFRYAILRQLSFQIQNSGIDASLGGSGLNTNNGYILYKFTIEENSDVKKAKTVQYYIIGVKKHILIHLTDYYNKNNTTADEVALFIANSFIWSK